MVEEPELWADELWDKQHTLPCADDFNRLKEAALASLASAHRALPARVHGDLRSCNVFARRNTAMQGNTIWEIAFVDFATAGLQGMVRYIFTLSYPLKPEQSIFAKH